MGKQRSLLTGEPEPVMKVSRDRAVTQSGWISPRYSNAAAEKSAWSSLPS